MASGGSDSKVYFSDPDASQSEGQVIASRSFMSRLSSGLNDLRAEGKFCDVVIHIEDKQFPAHKVVLSAASDYFLAMFTSGFQESTSPEVRIQGESEAFEQLLNFAYTGTLNLSTETIRGVFQMACFMQTSDAIDICSIFLSEFFQYPKGSIGYDDIFLLWQLFDGQGMQKLARQCRRYMLQNFTGFSSSDAFLIYMTHHQMVEILEDEEIETEISGESQILQSIMRWLKHDWEARKGHAAFILKKVRLGMVPMERVAEIFDVQLADLPECRTLYDEVKRLRSMEGVSNTDLKRNHPELFASRGTITTLVAMGNKNGRKSIWYFDQSNRQWLAAMNFPFPSCGVLFGCQLIDVDGELHVSGGRAEDGETKSHFHRYDPEVNEWEVLPPMLHPKACHAMVQYKQHIYTVSCEGFTERYSLEEKNWEEMSFLPHLDGELSLVIFRDKLVAVERNADTASSMKVYDPSCDRWHVLDENIEAAQENSVRTLTVQDGVCYLLVHTGERAKVTCQANQLDCNFDDDEAPSISVGESFDQSRIPKNLCNAFCIRGNVYVKLYGYVHKTDITFRDGDVEDMNLWLWNDTTQLNAGAAVTNYTFDRHRLHPAYTTQ